MFISFIIAEFKCKRPLCDGKHVLAVNTGLSDISNIYKYISENTNCPKCKNPTDIKHIKVKIAISEDIYGDTTSGVWFCPDHPEKRYFPAAIKRVAKTKHSYGVLTGMNMYRYRAVTYKGHPWRCPICDKLLTYHEERSPLFDY